MSYKSYMTHLDSTGPTDSEGASDVGSRARQACPEERGEVARMCSGSLPPIPPARRYPRPEHIRNEHPSQCDCEGIATRGDCEGITCPENHCLTRLNSWVHPA